MAKRMVDTELWNNEEIIENFTAEDKYFWLYLLTSPHNNICGVFKNSPALIARDMGLHRDTVVNLIYRFERVHKLIYVDKETNEILILNWYKFNWTKSDDFIRTIEKQMSSIKSRDILTLIQERIIDKINKTVSRPSQDGTNTITNINNNIVCIDDINLYFDKIYSIYPRKVSKVRAKETFEHKLRGLEKDEAKRKAVGIYRMLEKQIEFWKAENDGQGRKIEHLPHFSTWCNDNVENSPHFKRGKR